jgi:L-iditol 2-dehydrogenase
VRNGGVVVMFAPPPPQDMLTLNPNALYFAEKQLVPSYSSSHVDTREALRLLQSGVVDLQKMITHTFPMEDAENAFRIAESREGLKVLITNG